MFLSDPIADLLTRIRNAKKARHLDLKVPGSLIKTQILDILKKEGFISGYSVSKEGFASTILVELKYEQNGKSFIQSLDRISKPGKRIYKGYEELAAMKDVISLQIVSTSKGLMTDRDAVAAKLGGEVLCKIS